MAHEICYADQIGLENCFVVRRKLDGVLIRDSTAGQRAVQNVMRNFGTAEGIRRLCIGIAADETLSALWTSAALRDQSYLHHSSHTATQNLKANL